MKTTRQNGFVMVFVIVSLIVVGVLMYVLADDSNTMLFQSDAAYLRAVQRNLTASGLAWARNNVKSQNAELFNKPTELDVSGLGIGQASLSVTIDVAPNQKPQGQINTSCTRKRRTFTGRNKYTVDL
ncbi:MAG: hypothetical protein KAY65_15680 [Planctomycetes bacterium]|nr:hypothetical protein [Planctomycetota bacterium]